MLRIIFPIILFSLLINASNNKCLAQEVKINITKIETIDNKLVINYDFTDDVSKNEFDVWIEISTKEGRRINARSLSGDIGDNLKAGKGKKITWDFIADDIVIDEEVNFEIKAIVSRGSNLQSKSITGGKALLMSAVMPGLGISKLGNGKPTWLLGVSTYLLAGSSIFLNRMADDKYTSYATDLNSQSSEDSFKKSQSYDKLSKIAAYSAIGTWCIGIIWTAAKASKNKKSTISEYNKRKLHFHTYFDHHNKTTGFSIKYRF